MDLGLRDKVVLITGGSQGIGRATALSFANEGAKVAICARGKEALDQTAAEVAAKGVEVFAEPTDVKDAAQIDRFVQHTIERFGGVDILVNNAVSFVLGAAGELPDDAWQHHFEVKLLAFVRTCRAVLPSMRSRGGGRIINVGGVAARSSGGGGSSAGAINAAIVNFSKSLSDQVAREGILVNCIHPGGTRTARHEIVLQRVMQTEGLTHEEAERRSVANMPIGRMIEPEDVADLIVFLCSSHASAITGQTIAVDGGATRGVFY